MTKWQSSAAWARDVRVRCTFQRTSRDSRVSSQFGSQRNPRAKLDPLRSGPVQAGWGQGQLAQKGDVLAAYDVAAELEALLSFDGHGESVHGAPGGVSPQHAWSLPAGDGGLDIVDIDDGDLADDSKRLGLELQAQLETFEADELRLSG